MSYSLSNHYLPPPQPSSYYAQPSHLAPLPSLHSTNPQRQPTELSQRKRPKYTRSKTGCLTCRVKKVKCDESKPICVRCSHGQRDCTWPEGVPTRKKPASRKDSVEADARPSTADSSGLSEGSAPSTREHSPPRRSVDLTLSLPHPSRRAGDPYYSQSFKADPDPSRLSLQLSPERASPYIYPAPGPDTLPALHEPYQPQSRYDHAYSNSSSHHSRQPGSTAYRSYSHHEPVNQWHAPSSTIDPYYHHPVSERTLVSHGSSHEPHHRYQ